MDKERMYRMTEGQRQKYLILLLTERVHEATAFRAECDSYWAEHTDEWEKVKLPDGAPIPL